MSCPDSNTSKVFCNKRFMNKSIIYEQITSISVLARQLPQSLHGVLWHGLTFLFIFLLFLLFIVNYLLSTHLSVVFYCSHILI